MSHYEEYKVADKNILLDFMRSYPFATISRNDPDSNVPAIVHAPVLITGEHEVEFHIANANPAWQNFLKGGPSTFLFKGPNAYISPSWYKTRFADGNRSKTAPTWDYTLVDMKGLISPMTESLLTDHLDRLVSHFESAVHGDWSFQEIDRDFLHRLRRMITGFSVEVHEMVGTFKLSQEQADADRQHIIENLTDKTDTKNRDMARFIRDFTGL
ncbi:MAG: FMN-binding negative transcriptional regulator [Alphaproteobacteria bacterium]|nr:FMN-binding negative transcriptional regulator [Alphaproteobacteria bacterium]